MYSRSRVAVREALLGATIACALMAGPALAAEHPFVASSQINTAGLDTTKAADMQTLYSRLRHAAEDVCAPQYRLGLKPVAHPKSCYEKALGDSIRAAKLPLLTQAYLTDHTIQEAVAHGLEAPSLASR